MKMLYEFIGGILAGQCLEREVALAIASGDTGSRARERAQGARVRREELDHQPTVKGYLGPMWDGLRYEIDGRLRYEFETTPEQREGREPIAILRYETQAVYDMLSR